MPVDEEPEGSPGLPGTSLTRLPRAAVLAAQDARLPASLLGDYLPTLASAAQTGRRLAAAELARFHGLGQAAAESGASLRALVDLYLSATWRAWPSLPAVRAAGTRNEADRTRAAAAAVLRASDDAVAAVCEGYEAARSARARAEEALRRELIDDLLTGTSTDPGLVLERSAAFGLHLEAPHVVFVAAGERRFVDGRGTSRAVDAALRSTCATEPLVAVKDGLLVCVVPQEPADDPTTAEPVQPEPPRPGPPAAGAGQQGPEVGGRPGPGGGGSSFFTPLRNASVASSGAPRALGALTAALSAAAGSPPWRVGVSRPRTGVTGTRIGFAEASSVVELAGRLGLVRQPTHADDLLIFRVLLRDREALVELVDSVLGPLRTARGGAGPLLDTLDAYFAAGAVALAAARRLHLSARALTYRLDRVHQLTGHDPTAPTDRYVLQTAVLGARLLDWDPPTP
ncbi:helix-turn-helix domain-containing protein [Frankia sp. AgB1.9]|uniref:PucR family transcriptional regulator n=1 Tax=unclassified Frankia TaxID=2632575 RepID=UPI0019341A9B|nr:MULTISPECIES: helix-turn-helix domain-containing protein [unclassified Frankia]MBL7489309.1 helix-turn-helix domain-containing protein [Frankia sp. AgW1.1]MBL7548482.1 helix-turn-helix domain-containing protein [Frankia sp. AgB1.9]MBL7623075.1 helix-turn-helix domain-containing protein [Frankia sp. AgB1.8]